MHPRNVTVKTESEGVSGGTLMTNDEMVWSSKSGRLNIPEPGEVGWTSVMSGRVDPSVRVISVTEILVSGVEELPSSGSTLTALTKVSISRLSSLLSNLTVTVFGSSG